MSEANENLPMPNPKVDHATTVRAFLAASDLPAFDDEIAVIAAGYSGLRAGINALYAVPDVRYADPTLRFQPDVAPSTAWVD